MAEERRRDQKNDIMPHLYASNSPRKKSFKSLNFVQRKHNLEKIVQDNIMMMKKIHFA